jgi:hypothetical protein
VGDFPSLNHFEFSTRDFPRRDEQFAVFCSIVAQRGVLAKPWRILIPGVERASQAKTTFSIRKEAANEGGFGGKGRGLEGQGWSGLRADLIGS